MFFCPVRPTQLFLPLGSSDAAVVSHALVFPTVVWLRPAVGEWAERRRGIVGSRVGRSVLTWSLKVTWESWPSVGCWGEACLRRLAGREYKISGGLGHGGRDFDVHFRPEICGSSSCAWNEFRFLPSPSPPQTSIRSGEGCVAQIADVQHQ